MVKKIRQQPRRKALAKRDMRFIVAERGPGMDDPEPIFHQEVEGPEVSRAQWYLPRGAIVEFLDYGYGSNTWGPIRVGFDATTHFMWDGENFNAIGWPTLTFNGVILNPGVRVLVVAIGEYLIA